MLQAYAFTEGAIPDPTPATPASESALFSSTGAVAAEGPVCEAGLEAIVSVYVPVALGAGFVFVVLLVVPART